MPASAIVTLIVLLASVALLVRGRYSPAWVLGGGVGVLLMAGIITPQQALSAAANEGLATVAVLFVVAEGLRQTGLVSLIADGLLGRQAALRAGLIRLMLPTAALSAFMNNTPLVAVMVPAVSEWARKRGLSVSRLLMPLSFAAILGGTCTLIGTSTNLIVNGMLADVPSATPLGFLDLAWVGVPLTLLGVAYMLVFASRLPDRRPAAMQFDNPREYTIEMLVEPDGPLVGQRVEEAGLRHLQGLFLAEIDREGEVRTAIGPEEVLHAGDRLVFVGVVESVKDLHQMRGLSPAGEPHFDLHEQHPQRLLVEAVVSGESPMLNTTIRDGRFRSRYNAVVIAVSRGGSRIARKIGDIRLRAGDTLLLETHPHFVGEHRNRRDFLLVRAVEDSQPPRHDRAWLSALIAVGMIVAVLFGAPLILAAIAASGAMIVSGCLRMEQVRSSLPVGLLTAVGAALALGSALTISGAAGAIAGPLITLAGGSPILLLAAVLLLTIVATEFVTNNAAAVLIFPIAASAAVASGWAVEPFAVAIMIGASASFLTPIGYQTNLMVYGPGGYRYTDFTRFGAPLTAIVIAAVLLIVPAVWPVANQ